MVQLDQYRTLILDSGWKPVKVVPWQKGVIYSLQDKVLVLETYDRVIRSPNFELAIPAVVVLRQYLRVHPFRVRWSKRNVFARDEFTCQYCGCEPGLKNLTIDHVLPVSRGGGSTWENTVAACGPCNHRKGDRLPSEAGMPLLTRPRRPSPMQEAVLGSRTAPPEWDQYLAVAG